MTYKSEVTVTLTFKKVPVRTDVHPEDLTVTQWKKTLSEQIGLFFGVESELSTEEIRKAIRDYKITNIPGFQTE